MSGRIRNVGQNSGRVNSREKKAEKLRLDSTFAFLFDHSVTF